MSTQIILNHEQGLYVIPHGDGYSCFGFKNASADTEKIARALERTDLIPTPEIFGTTQGYELYLTALEAWGNSVLSRQTWFSPGTDSKVQKVFEAYRKSQQLIRVFYGDPATGKDSCEEWDVVGRVGRSGGTMKVPLIVPSGEFGGLPVLTNRVVRLMDVATNKDLYRHPKYTVPEIRIETNEAPLERPELIWAAYRDGELVARFETMYEASEWAEFITGRIATKREDVLTALKLAA